MTILKLGLNKIIFFLLYAFILLYPTGPFISDVIISIIGLSIILSLNNKKVFIKLLNEKFIFIILIFYLSINVSSLFSDYSNISFPRSFVFLRWILFIIFAYLSFKAIQINKINYSIVFIIIFCILDCFYQYYFSFDLFGFPTLSSSPAVNSDYRLLTGPFGNEPIVSSFIVKLLFPTIYFFILSKNFYIKKYISVIFFVIFFLSFFIILISGQRVSLIYLIIGLLLFLLINIKYFFNYNIIKKKYLKYFILVILSFIILSIFTFYKLSNNSQYSNRMIDGFKNEFNHYYIGDSHYAKLHKISFQIFKENIFFGIGLKSFRFKCLEENNSLENINLKLICSTHPHNYYIEILTETGIIGLSLFLIFLILIITKYLSFKKNYLSPNHADGFFISFFICIFPIVPTGSFFSNYNSSLFWFILSLLLINIYKQKNV